MVHLLCLCWVTGVAVNTCPPFIETPLPHPWSTERRKPSDYSWAPSSHAISPQMRLMDLPTPWSCWNAFNWLRGLWGPECYWPLLMITEWLLRWVRFSWKPWLLKSSGYMRIPVFILKEKISSPGRCRKVLKMWYLRDPNTLSNTKKWNYFKSYFLKSYYFTIRLTINFLNSWHNMLRSGSICSLTSEKACNNDKLFH